MFNCDSGQGDVAGLAWQTTFCLARQVTASKRILLILETTCDVSQINVRDAHNLNKICSDQAFRFLQGLWIWCGLSFFFLFAKVFNKLHRNRILSVQRDSAMCVLFSIQSTIMRLVAIRILITNSNERPGAMSHAWLPFVDSSDVVFNSIHQSEAIKAPGDKATGQVQRAD